MKMMEELPNHLLLEAYYKAKELNLQAEFIQLIEAEMKRRKLL